MACNFDESFSIDDVFKELMHLFEECCDNNNESIVPIQVFIKKIASSVQLKSFAGSHRDLEDLLRKILGCPVGDVDTPLLTKHDFTMKMKNYIDNVDCELKFSLNNYVSHKTGADFGISKLIDKNDFIETLDLDEINCKCPNELIDDKESLEMIGNSFQERIETIERMNTSLMMEKNSLQSSLRDAAKRDSYWEQTVIQLRSQVIKLERCNFDIKQELLTQEEILKEEKQKCYHLEERLNSTENQNLSLSLQLTAANDENHLLIQNLNDLEKKLELVNMHYSKACDSLERHNSQIVSLEEQLDKVWKEKQDVECQLVNSLHRLRLINYLRQDLEVDNNLLKDKLSGKESEGALSPVRNAVLLPYTSAHVGCSVSNDCDYLKGSYDNETEYESQDVIFVSLPFGRLYKSLEEEIQDVEGGIRIGCRSSQLDIDPLLVEKIEKQQLVIEQLAETIAHFSVGEMSGNSDGDIDSTYDDLLCLEEKNGSQIFTDSVEDDRDCTNIDYIYSSSFEDVSSNQETIFMQAFRNREESKKKSHRPSNLFICSAMIILTFVLLTFISSFGDVGGIRCANIQSKSSHSLHPMSYYDVEELIQPLIGLWWHQPPPM